MSHIRDRLIQLKNEVENTGNGAYFSKNNISKIVELLFTDLEQDEKENGWIPVSERLPEDEKEYLVTLEKVYGTPEKLYGIANYLKFGDAGYWNEKKYGYLEWDNIQMGMEEQRCIKLLPGCHFQNHTRRTSHDYILIRIHPWNHIWSGRSYMRGDHVRQASSSRIERRMVC